VVESPVSTWLADGMACRVAQGAGAASFAATMQERQQLAGQVVGSTLSGGNVDAAALARVLQNQ
jgi:threonine dehydratase